MASAARTHVAARRARWLERRALEALGREITASVTPTLLPSVDALRESANREGALRDLLTESLAEDRRDWRDLPAWFRPLVVVRGGLVRLVLWLRILQERGQRPALHRKIGAAALAERPDLRSSAADRVRVLRSVAEDARKRFEITRAAAPRIIVRSAARAGQESTHFVRALFKEIRSVVVPRLPGLAGLAVGWWIANTYTDSGFEATLHSWGIGDGPRNAVSSETLRTMNFWLPLLAAATCSYAAQRLAAWVRARYQPETTVLTGKE